MARIRTIKPEFWTDEAIVKLPFEARLLFIGMWNFADDSGALDYSPDRIRLQILPDESNCDITGLIDLLVAAGLIDYWVNEEGTQAITVRNWLKHQKIDNPSRKSIIREGYRKKAIPTESRVGVAKKYGCLPGGEVDAACYYCGMPGKVKWWNGSSGKPSRWITLSELEFDHFVSEHSGGSLLSENIVLACRCCNRGKREFDPHQFFAIKNPTVLGEEKISLDIPSEDSPLERKGSRIKDQGPKDQGPKEDQPAKADKFVLPEWIDKQKWDLWQKTRKGKKMLPEQMQAQVDKLRKWKDSGMDYSLALAESADNGWTGLFEPKLKQSNSPPQRQSRMSLDGIDYTVGLNSDGSLM
jgi:hypothetical protein